MKDYYRILGIRRTATPPEVRAAYLHRAKQLHPDVNPSEDAAAQFVEVKEAYDILGDPAKRSSFDATLAFAERQEVLRKEAEAAEARREFFRQQAATEAAQKKAAPPPTAPSDQLKQLQDLLKVGRFKDAEDLAQAILAVSGRSAPAWAALGDIARMKGSLMEAAKCYAYAAQFDPSTEAYIKRHEEVSRALSSPTGDLTRDHMPAAAKEDGAQTPLGVLGLVVLILGCWIVVDRTPFIAPIGPLADWTMAMGVSLILAGFFLGACLRWAGLMDRMSLAGGSAIVKTPFIVVLGLIALVNYWLMALVYFVQGALQNGFQRSLNSLLTGTTAVLIVLSLLAAFVTPSGALSCLLWGGFLIYAPALVGWAGADALKRGS